MLLGTMRKIIFGCLLLCLNSCSSDKGYEPLKVPITTESVAHGRELFNGVAACAFCHGDKPLPNALPSGGRIQHDLYGDVAAANLTPSKSGIGDWQAKDFISAIRDGLRPDGAKLSPEVHRGMEWMADTDLLAMVAYLTTLPAVENRVERRELGFVSRNTTGFFQGRHDVGGYVPKVDPKHELPYGKYLVDNVARCSYCHSSPASVLSSEGYLQGGHTMQFEGGEKLIPSITNSSAHGIGNWTESEIVTYLKSGDTPDHRRISAEFCPVGFYKMAAERELLAIAKYLKSDLSSK